MVWCGKGKREEGRGTSFFFSGTRWCVKERERANERKE